MATPLGGLAAAVNVTTWPGVGAVGDQSKSSGMTLLAAELAPGATASAIARMAIAHADEIRRTDERAKLLSTERCFGGIPAAACRAAGAIDKRIGGLVEVCPKSV
jgi:hypothetical protein